MTKGERTKQRIVDSSIELFFKNGYAQVSFQDIADTVELSQPALYNYFDNKVDILGTCAKHSSETATEYVKSQIDPMAPPKAQLKSFIEANLKWFHGHPSKTSAICSALYFSTESSKIEEVRSRIEKLSIEKIEVVVQQGHLAKSWNCKDIATKARLIHSLLNGEVFKQFHSPKALGLAKRSEQVFEATLSILGA